MKVFICNRSIDNTEAISKIDELLVESDEAISIQREITHSENWKSIVAKKIQECEFIIFLLGEETFQSDQLKWEYAKAKEMNKQIIGLELPSASEESIVFCQGFQVFKEVDNCVKFLRKTIEDDRQLLLEQYKIMVASTEKVTDQRMKVNNLFFTVTSTILSLTIIVGKTLDFSMVGILGMLSITLMAFLATFFWENLIESYGKLNTGKFKLIDKIEKRLRTNMFEDEWKILTTEISYEPNTKTETKIVKKFRLFILIIALLEFAYIVSKIVEYFFCKN